MNQEDSLILTRAAVEWGIFVDYYTYMLRTKVDPTTGKPTAQLPQTEATTRYTFGGSLTKIGLKFSKDRL